MNVGEKVVCVDDKMTPQVIPEFFPNWIKEGESYTVRAREGSMGTDMRILLEEISNPSQYFPELGGKTEPGFSQRRFVPYSEFVIGETMKELVDTEVEEFA